MELLKHLLLVGSEDGFELVRRILHHSAALGRSVLPDRLQLRTRLVDDRLHLGLLGICEIQAGCEALQRHLRGLSGLILLLLISTTRLPLLLVAGTGPALELALLLELRAVAGARAALVEIAARACAGLAAVVKPLGSTSIAGAVLVEILWAVVRSIGSTAIKTAWAGTGAALVEILLRAKLAATVELTRAAIIAGTALHEIAARTAILPATIIESALTPTIARPAIHGISTRTAVLPAAIVSLLLAPAVATPALREIPTRTAVLPATIVSLLPAPAVATPALREIPARTAVLPTTIIEPASPTIAGATLHKIPLRSAVLAAARAPSLSTAKISARPTLPLLLLAPRPRGRSSWPLGGSCDG
ncbi:MAG TPA: hypothetical protein VG733_18675 [Chthoniobacteraceae bacterium]|nr:hypothetical protein [Chthoniobacteraceae bacterium]